MKQRLAIVSGATGDLGRAYLQHYAQELSTTSYGIARRTEPSPIPTVHYLTTDLEDSLNTQKQVASIPFGGIERITLIHPVGNFKFESNGTPEVDEEHDGIDDEVFTSNVGTFYNLVKPLLGRRGDIPLTLVAFGSLSDPYNVPWWGSYSKAKLILRKEMHDLARLNRNVRSVFVNLSSVRTSNEIRTRPFADMKYWISPDEIVKRSIDLIDAAESPYLEVDLYKSSPEYHSGYYSDFTALKEKWQREMGNLFKKV